jgi:hypothetical protein
MFQLVSYEDHLSRACCVSIKHGEAAPYQPDKALSKTGVSGTHLNLKGRKSKMRNYRKAIAALALALVFATSAFADDGIMYTDRTQPPPPSTSSQTVTTDGIMYTDNTQPATEATDTATQIAASLVQSVLTLL